MHIFYLEVTENPNNYKTEYLLHMGTIIRLFCVERAGSDSSQLSLYKVNGACVVGKPLGRVLVRM